MCPSNGRYLTVRIFADTTLSRVSRDGMQLRVQPQKIHKPLEVLRAVPESAMEVLQLPLKITHRPGCWINRTVGFRRRLRAIELDRLWLAARAQPIQPSDRLVERDLHLGLFALGQVHAALKVGDRAARDAGGLGQVRL